MPAKVKGLYWDEKAAVYAYDFRIRGHRFRGSTEETDRRRAEKFVKDKRREAESVASQDSGDEPMTFAVASTRWYGEKGGKRARSTEVERYLAWLQTKIGKSTLVSKIDDNLVARLVVLRQEEKVADSTVNRTVLEPLRAILRRASLWGQTIAKIEWAQHLLDEPKERVRELTAAEEQKLFAKLRPSYQAIIRFAVLSALRRHELLAMDWEHVDWGGRRLNLIGKGDVVAFIPLSVEMERLLRGAIPPGETHPAGPVWLYKPERHEEGADNLTPRPITEEGLKTEFRRARKRAGMTSSKVDPLMGYRFHDNRHTGITRLVRDSGNLKLGQKLARHASIATTMKYAHATEDDLRKAMDSAHSPRQSSHEAETDTENANEIKRIG
jgi:integrase